MKTVHILKRKQAFKFLTWVRLGKEGIVVDVVGLVLLLLNQSIAKHGPTAGSPQMRHMDKQVAHRLRRSSIG